MNHKIIYILLLSFFCLGDISAQSLSCTSIIDVSLDSDSQGEIIASDLVENLDFFLANGTVLYFIVPFNSGEINSADDVITFNCNSIGTHNFLVEYTVDGSLVSSCFGTIKVQDPLGSCPNYSFCDDPETDCPRATGSFATVNFDFGPIPAADFAICSQSLGCTGDYTVAIGFEGDAANLTFGPSIISDNIVDFSTPIVLAYTVDGDTQYDQSYLYVWNNLECIIFPESSVTVELDITAEATLLPEIFLGSLNTCSEVTIAITELNGPAPTEFFESLTVTCDDSGYSTIYLKDAETGFIAESQVFVSDPLETCGPILGPGDRLIKMSNNPPAGTYANAKVSINGEVLPVSTVGKGWVINEDMLIDGLNTLEFDAGQFNLNGVSTLDLVNLLRIIINDDYDSPIQSIVMDIDDSGYNGIYDLVLLRQLILGQPVMLDLLNALFVPKELEFPSDFNPFDFDYDFTKYEFNKDDFYDLSFRFNGYKVGDSNSSAVIEDSLYSENIITTRDLDIFEISNMDIEPGVPFVFSLKYDNDTPIKGLLAALVSDGVKFQTLTSTVGNEVQYNIIDDTEIRISYLSSDPSNTINSISFEISAVSDKSGDLIDLLGLKAGFPQEVIDENDDVIDIEDLEEALISSVENINSDLQYSIYPNPVGQDLKIKVSDGALGRIEILDPMGQVLLIRNSDSNEVSIDVSELANGLYFLNVAQNNNAIQNSFLKI